MSIFQETPHHVKAMKIAEREGSFFISFNELDKDKIKLLAPNIAVLEEENGLYQIWSSGHLIQVKEENEAINWFFNQ